MQHSKKKTEIKSEGQLAIQVVHDLQRQIMEIPSLFRVIDNYYKKKSDIQQQLKPSILKKFKEGLRMLEQDIDWLFTIPTALTTLNEEFLRNKDSFRFPDSIKLFEAWMNLGLDALYPRFVLHFRYPGFLKGELVRHVFQFIFATSRGFGFPIYFGPEFYDYELKYSKYIQWFFKWGYTVCHKANQALRIVAGRLNLKRHHPGEFESVIISEYENNVYRGIDTLLHGYFTSEPKYLGTFNSLEAALQKIIFYYTIGDHAMSVEKGISNKILTLPLITHESIVKKYDIDFYSYIKNLLEVNKLLIKKITFYKKKRKKLINELKLVDKLKFRIEQSKELSKIGQKLSVKYPEIKKFSNYKFLMEKLRDLLFITPIYMHTIHTPSNLELDQGIIGKSETIEEYERESSNSILLSFIKKYEHDHAFIFEEKEVIKEIKGLRDNMAKMWLYFKERQFKYAVKKLNQLESLSLIENNYISSIKEAVEMLIPIISIYEIFHRSLAESVYPESIPQTQRLWAYVAEFLTSKYNPIGVNLMNLFNKLAFHNWSYLILKKKMNHKQFFNFILKLPIFRNIPIEVKAVIMNYNA